jgi:hypothetical protein
VRRRWLAAAIALVQLSVPAALAIGLCCRPSRAAAADDMPCCAKGDAHHVCPLAKKSTPAGKSKTSLKSCCDPELQALMALTGPAGVLRSAAPGAMTLDETDVPRPLVVTITDWIVAVESPPPRI